MTVAIQFYAHFVTGGNGATGLTVTTDVYTVAKSNAAVVQVTTASTAGEIGDGGYVYRYATADLDTYDYFAVLKTTGTADQKQIPSLWSNYGIGNAAAIAGTAPASTALSTAVWTSTAASYLDASISSRLTYYESDTAAAGGNTTITLGSSANATNDNFYVGCQVSIMSGTGAHQTRVITGYVASTKVATVGRAWIVNPNGTSVYHIEPFQSPALDSTLAVTLTSAEHALWAAAPWNELATAHNLANTTGKMLQDINNNASLAALNVPPTTDEISTGVWSDSTAYAPGSKGAQLASAGSAGDPLINAVPGVYAAGSAGYALGRIGTSPITVTSPVGVASSLTLYVGDDYKSADGRSIDISSVSYPSLTGATVAMRARMRTDPNGLTFSGSVVNSTTARIELTSAQTLSIGNGRGTYDIRATLSTSSAVVTLVEGTLVMKTI